MLLSTLSPFLLLLLRPSLTTAIPAPSTPAPLIKCGPSTSLPSSPTAHTDCLSAFALLVADWTALLAAFPLLPPPSDHFTFYDQRTVRHWMGSTIRPHRDFATSGVQLGGGADASRAVGRCEVTLGFTGEPTITPENDYVARPALGVLQAAVAAVGAQCVEKGRARDAVAAVEGWPLAVWVAVDREAEEEGKVEGCGWLCWGKKVFPNWVQAP